MIILYKTLGCPRCKALQSVLDKKQIKYVPIVDIDAMLTKGYETAPILEIDDVPLSFVTAMQWANSYSGE